MYIISTGLTSPVGLYSESACAALRAGISAFEELSYVDNLGDPVVGAFIPNISKELKKEDKLLLMLTQAVSECVERIEGLNLSKVPIFVCLAEEGRPGGDFDLSSTIIGRVEQTLKLNFDSKFSKTICKGHTSAFEALIEIRALMKKGLIRQALLCGVDSYINAGSLLWLDQYQRLKTKNNSDGVIPGEAAGAVIVSKIARHDNDCRNTIIGSLGTGEESTTVLDDAPLMAKGMTKAIQSALNEANLKMHEIDLRMTDVTGEAYYFKEQLYSKMKIQRKDAKQFVDLWHSSENIGDVGSVSGLVQLIYAKVTIAGKMGCLRNLLCTTSNASNSRAAAIIKFDS